MIRPRGLVLQQDEYLRQKSYIGNPDCVSTGDQQHRKPFDAQTRTIQWSPKADLPHTAMSVVNPWTFRCCIASSSLPKPTPISEESQMALHLFAASALSGLRLLPCLFMSFHNPMLASQKVEAEKRQNNLNTKLQAPSWTQI